MLQDVFKSARLKYWRRQPAERAVWKGTRKMVAGPAPSVAELIRRDVAAFTPSERRATQRLLADYPVAGLDTVARFGEAAGVSGPTVLRMIAKLGFRSYGAFQDALREELAARLETPLSKGGDLSGDNHLTRFAEASIANIRQTVANVAKGEFDAMVRLLADRGRPVHVVGGRFTDSMADYFVSHLRVLRPRVRRITGGPMNWLDQLLDIGKRDVVVIFDIRRYSDDLARLADKSARRGATVVLFTDQWLSPASRHARHVLPAHIVAPSVWDSASGLLLLVEALLAALATEFGPVVRDRLTAVERMRDE
jgi:DNA-binding MurR/RpiR family transcriptional regulator